MLWLLILAIIILALLLLAVCFGILDDLHVRPRPIAGRKRVACVGDSITYGCLLPGQPWNSYPRQLGRLLGNGYCVGNFGYSNRTALKGGNHPYTVEKLYQWSLDYQPDIVLLMLGSNDTKAVNWDAAAYARDLGELIDSYRSLESSPRVWLLLPPPAFPFRGKVLWDIRSEVLEQEVLPICRQVAAEKKIPVIDTHTPFIGKKELFMDGLHPGARGGKLLAETVYGAIKGGLDG
ncbi:MAG: hypothetical protein IJ179_09015 [Oscillospiraceae bacterium]|nr:hypothetical protein [Oscillospiraceae bacterium]